MKKLGVSLAAALVTWVLFFLLMGRVEIPRAPDGGTGPWTWPPQEWSDGSYTAGIFWFCPDDQICERVDVNGDGWVDVVDVQLVVNESLRRNGGD